MSFDLTDLIFNSVSFFSLLYIRMKEWKNRIMMNDELWMMNEERGARNQIDKIKRFIIDPIEWIVPALFSTDGILIKQ